MVLECKRFHKLGRIFSRLSRIFMEFWGSKVHLAPTHENFINGVANPESSIQGRKLSSLYEIDQCLIVPGTTTFKKRSSEVLKAMSVTMVAKNEKIKKWRMKKTPRKIFVFSWPTLFFTVFILQISLHSTYVAHKFIFNEIKVLILKQLHMLLICLPI